MIIEMLMMAAAPYVERPMVGDPVAKAIVGLRAVIEDDVHPDTKLISMKSKGCQTLVVAAARKWTIDWSRAEAVSLEDTFVYVMAPPVKFAIVGDASKPNQAAKLRALAVAMQGMAERCRTAS
jgi:hypothetical protein